MKFIECYIENFGKLKEFRQEFKDGLNVILEDNGFGKTTFAAFLQAMFYGLDTGRTKDSDRKKYEPWQGGKFGGSLTFSVNGKNYRLERFFGKKEKDDTFILYSAETGLESKDFTENIGCEIFGIDKESYEKSVYIPQGKVEAELDKAGDINARLSDLLETDNDMASFDDAMENLKKLKNKYKRSNGLIAEKELVKSKLEAEIERAQELAVTENELKEKLSEKKNAKKLVDERIEMLHISVGKKEKAEHFKTLKKAVEDSEKRLKEYINSVKKVPDEEQLKELSIICDNYKEIKAMAKRRVLSDDEITLIKEAEEADIVMMSPVEYDEISYLIQKYNTGKEVVKAASLTEEEEEKLAKLKTKFDDETFDMSFAEKMYYRVTDAKEKIIKTEKNKKSAVPYMISALLVLLGTVLLFFLKPLFGIILITVGIIFAAVYFGTSFSEEKKKNKDISASEDVLKEADAFFISLGENTNEGYENALRNIRISFGEYNALLLKKKNAEEFSKNSDISKYKNALDEKTKNYLGKEMYSEECEDEFRNYVLKCINIKDAKDKKKDLEKLNSMAEDRYNLLKEKSAVYCDSLPEEAYEELKILTVKIGEEKNNHAARAAQLNDFIASNGEIEETGEEFDLSEIDALKENSEDLADEIKKLEKRISEITEYTEKVPELTSELSETSEEIVLMKKKVSLIDKAEEGLNKAKENLALKYLGPLGERFKKYTKLLSAPENAKLDAELNVGIVEFGEKHTAGSYSTGLKDAMAIALRFALTDALFEGEKPVVVLDDPFTNLDDNRIKSAKNMLETLSDEYQILYLTCHESRS